MLKGREGGGVGVNVKATFGLCPKERRFFVCLPSVSPVRCNLSGVIFHVSFVSCHSQASFLDVICHYPPFYWIVHHKSKVGSNLELTKF